MLSFILWCFSHTCLSLLERFPIHCRRWCVSFFRFWCCFKHSLVETFACKNTSLFDDRCLFYRIVCLLLLRACVRSFIPSFRLLTFLSSSFLLCFFFLVCCCAKRKKHFDICVPSITYWFFYSALTVNSHARQASFISSGFWTVEMFEESE